MFAVQLATNLQLSCKLQTTDKPCISSEVQGLSVV